MQGLLSNELLSRSNLFGSIGGSNIKSVQSGVINMSTTSKDNLIPISNVNLANSICYIVGTGSSFNPTQDKATIEFESSDQVKISVDFSPPSSTTLYWYVVEFNNLKSKQYGTITRPFSYIDITNINLQKSFIIYSYTWTETSYSANTREPYLIFNTTAYPGNIKLQIKDDYNCINKVNWQVIEFN